MISKLKIAVLAAVAAASLAAPAFAQSYDPEAGSGNVTTFGYAPSTNDGGFRSQAPRRGGPAIPRR